ncbi:MAG: tripartite tricarboxylate transporter substrate binding protein [Betaproteobacteria bacterium]|nr:tripartite tricarboxylate transporter substrate binding protein [Betaproteobacteria bacterium]
MFAIVVALFAPSAAAAYPEKPVRLIVPFSAGGATDVLARALSNKLEQALGTNIIVDNRGGAGGTLGAGVAARTPPDGYTLMLTSPSYTFTPTIYGKKLPYNALKDFTPITIMASVPHVLVVHPSMPVENFRQFRALARKNPGDILFSSGGRGSNIHLSTELFAYKANIKLLHVPYKGGGPGQIALISGEVQVMLPAVTPALPFIKSGRMRALGVTSKERSPALPKLPTLNESGLPGFDKSYWAGLFAPAGVPQPILDKVYQAAVEALKNPEIVKWLNAQGARPVGNPPPEFNAFVRSEIAAWRKLIREMGL